jgi:hypothetical protein
MTDVFKLNANEMNLKGLIQGLEILFRVGTITERFTFAFKAST